MEQNLNSSPILPHIDLGITHFANLSTNESPQTPNMPVTQTREPAPTPTPTHGPMIQQYLEIKKGLPEKTILLLRLGDFYEVFFEDAKTAAKIWGVALTKRKEVPMCGCPYHAKNKYIKTLTDAGYKVAIAGETEKSI